MSFKILMLIGACISFIDAACYYNQKENCEIDFNRLNEMVWFEIAKSGDGIADEIDACTVKHFVANSTHVTVLSRQITWKNKSDDFSVSDVETLGTFEFRSKCEVEKLPVPNDHIAHFRGNITIVTDHQDYLVISKCPSSTDSCKAWYHTPQTDPSARQLLKALNSWGIISITPPVGAKCLDLDAELLGRKYYMARLSFQDLRAK